MVMEQRSLVLFYHAIKSEHTRKTYEYWLERFRKFCGIRDFNSLVSVKPSELQVMLESYLFDRKKKASYFSIRTCFNALRLFFSMNDVTLNWQKIYKMFPERTKLCGNKAFTTDDLRKLLNSAKSPRDKALVHFVASSGIRARGIEDLRLKHISDMPEGCKCITIHADTKDEYYTFITAEASESLEEYFEFRRKKGQILNSESLVFEINPNYISVLFSDLVRKSTMHREKVQTNRYDKMSAHGLRKRFNTILKSNITINSNLAERLMGHSTTIKLDNSYFDPHIDDLFSEYQKAIPDLVVDEKYKLKLELENKDKRIKKLESDKDFRIHSLEQFVLELSKKLEAKV